MESAHNSATSRPKSAKASRRARKRRKSLASTLSKSSKSDDDRPEVKASPGPVAEAITASSPVTPLSAQPCPTPPNKPEDAVPSESAAMAAAFTESPAVAVGASAHLAFDDTLRVEEPVVVASPLSPAVIPAKAPSDQQSIAAEAGSAGPPPRPSFGANASAADDVHHPTPIGLQARLRSSDAAVPAATAQVPCASQTRKPSCGQLVLIALPRALLAVFALAAVFVAVSILTPKPRPHDVCRSHTCAEYSGRLRRSVNLLVSPCISLTRFVCAHWRQHDDLGVRPGVVEAALGRMSRLALSLRGSSPRPRTAAQFGAAFFRSCNAVFRCGTAPLQSLVP
ncbi:uncharacterized protein LOC142584200 [Dermacentor variabilis]|uniref:uncharacterized protein LOC142584200 n=1 Tax=Dermacentor variabilis TaxID=34621 RepID=UPI003F5BA887